MPKLKVQHTLSPDAVELLEELAETLGLSRSTALELAIRRLWATEKELAAKLKRRKRRR